MCMHTLRDQTRQTHDSMSTINPTLNLTSPSPLPESDAATHDAATPPAVTRDAATLLSNGEAMTPSSNCDSVTPPSSATRKSRFRFNIALDLLLCKAIFEKNAHAPPQNQKMKLMNEACELFLTIIPPRIREMYADPKGKTISDRFELIAKQRRSDDGKNRAATGIAEERTELDMLLDDMLLQRDELEEQRRKERDEKTEKDKNLEEASMDIRSKALSRSSAVSASGEDGNESKRKVRRVVSLDSDDEELEILKSAIDERRQNERKRLDIEQERLAFEMKQAKERSEKAEREHELEKKRLDIQQGELELARQKTFAELASQRTQMDERKVLVSVLSGLAKKLGE